MDDSCAVELPRLEDQRRGLLLRFGHRAECEWCGRMTDHQRLVDAGPLSAFEARICMDCAAEEEAAQERARELDWHTTSFDEFRF